MNPADQAGAVRRDYEEIPVAIRRSCPGFDPQLVTGNEAHGQLCLQYFGGLYEQDFDTLSASGSNNTTVPIGFAFLEAGGNVTYQADDGDLSTANTYSYRTGTNADRAFGEITSSTLQTTIGGCVVNKVGAITSFKVGYTGEEWRLGVADATLDRLDFQFSVNATAVNRQLDRRQ